MECTQCADTHYLDSVSNVNICREHGIAHCKVAALTLSGRTWPDLEYKCITCVDNYYLYDDDTCKPFPSDISDCEIYERKPSTELTRCNTCNEGFHTNADKSACENNNDNSIAGCTEYGWTTSAYCETCGADNKVVR